VKADEALFDVETDKVSTEIPAPASGVLAEIVVAEGVTAKVGARLAVIRESAPHQAPGSSATSTAAPINAAREPNSAMAALHTTPQGRASESPADRGHTAGAAARLSPVVSRLIAEHGLNPRDIRGTGRDRRVTREDVLAHVAQRGAAAGPAPARAPAAEGQEIVPLNIIRKRTAEHMAKSWTTVPHVLQAVEVDFSRVDQARRMTGEQWKKREGFSLTYLPFIAFAAAAALIKYSRLNASFHGDHLVVHRRVNLAIAVDLDGDGLLAPVVKDAAAWSLPQLARAINELAGRARAGKLKPDDMTEGTYTITNNGAFGTLITAPIINPPQVAILSTDGVRKRAVVVESAGADSITVRPIGVLAQSFDHRAVDGAYSAAFLNEVKAIIETRDWEREL
jgi:pyruvate dehydrogenase E2 component (dihydrolipoamide acetyltransferase)